MASIEEILMKELGFAPNSARSERGGGRPRGRPILEAQADILQRCFADLINVHTFKPGDLVVEKHGWGMTTSDDGSTMLLIYLGPLDPDKRYYDSLMVREMAKRVATKMTDYDCMVAFCSDDGGEMIVIPHCIAQLKPWVLEPIEASKET